jgi:hypothetical protein
MNNAKKNLESPPAPLDELDGVNDKLRKNPMFSKDIKSKATSPKKILCSDDTEKELKRINSELVMKIKDKITCWKNLGFDGGFVMLFTTGISMLFLYITYLYTKYFTYFHRPFVWVFMLFSISYAGLTMIYLCTWKKMAKKYILETKVSDNSNNSNIIEIRNICCQSIQRVRRARRKFYINGTYFLWKLYLFEFLEGLNQIYNFVTLYLCALPVFITTSICLLLAFDGFYRAYQLTKQNTIQRRNCQVSI